MAETAQPLPGPSCRDRHVGLLAFGIVQIVLGVTSFGLAALTALSMLVFSKVAPAGSPQVTMRQVLPSLGVYVIGGAVLIWLGIGSVRCRRWARPVTLVVNWVWLLMGVMTTVMTIFVMPKTLAILPAQPSAVSDVIMTIILIFMTLFGICLPLAFILFFRSPDVAATCATRDPRPRWTDGIPIPLLGLVLWLASVALMAVLAIPFAILPFGATVLTGPSAVLVDLLLAAVNATLAIGLYRRSRAAWWVALAGVAVAGAWGIWNLTRTNFAELQRQMGLVQSPSAPDLSFIYHSPWMVGVMVISWLGLIAFLLYVRRFLHPLTPAGTTGNPESALSD